MSPIQRTSLFLILLLFLSLALSTSINAQTPTNPDKANTPDLPGEPQPPAPEPPRPANSHTFTDAALVGIPDNPYIGTLDGNDGFGTDAGMICSTINSALTVPPGASVYNASISVNALHSWIGDLTIKLRSPSGTILTLLNRPGSTAGRR